MVQLQHLDQHEDSCGFTPAVCRSIPNIQSQSSVSPWTDILSLFKLKFIISLAIETPCNQTMNYMHDEN